MVEREGAGQRLTRPQYYLRIAAAVAERSTCPRLSVGAIVVWDRDIIGTGYNGAPRRIEECTEVGCMVIGDHCIIAVHAEQNAVLQALKHRGYGHELCLYSTHQPCWECAKTIINAGIKEVTYAIAYTDNRGNSSLLMTNAGILVHHLKELP